MKKLLVSALLGASVFAAAPASATVFFTDDITSDLVVSSIGATAEFGNAPVATAAEPRVNGFFDFQDTFTFTYAMPGSASGSATNNRVTVKAVISDIDFTNITFNSVAGTVANIGGLSVATFEDVAFVSGLQSIVISGKSNATASKPVSYGGSVTILNGAVPEPATWALMILGFGLVGASMRRRRRSMVAA